MKGIALTISGGCILLLLYWGLVKYIPGWQWSWRTAILSIALGMSAGLIIFLCFEEEDSSYLDIFPKNDQSGGDKNRYSSSEK